MAPLPNDTAALPQLDVGSAVSAGLDLDILSLFKEASPNFGGGSLTGGMHPFDVKRDPFTVGAQLMVEMRKAVEAMAASNVMLPEPVLPVELEEVAAPMPKVAPVAMPKAKTKTKSRARARARARRSSSAAGNAPDGTDKSPFATDLKALHDTLGVSDATAQARVLLLSLDIPGLDIVPTTKVTTASQAVMATKRKLDAITAESTAGLSKEAKKQRRLVRNRMSAQLHRERKKAYLESLENKVKELEAFNLHMSKGVEMLAGENTRMKAQLEDVTARKKK